VAAGRLSAAMRALQGTPVAPASQATWRAAGAFFPPATPTLAPIVSVEAAFPAEMARAAACGALAAATPALSAEAVTSATRSLGRDTAPGPSGLRPEHLWALPASGRDALVAVVRLLAAADSTAELPTPAAYALASADLLLLVKPGGPGADGQHELRPIAMPEVLRKLVATALMRSVSASAGAFLSPYQQVVGIPGPCERLLKEVDAELAASPRAAMLQLYFKNAFNLVSRSAAPAVIDRDLPSLSPYLAWVYGRGAAAVYGWRAHPSRASPHPLAHPPPGARDGWRRPSAPTPPAARRDPPPPAPPAARLFLLIERGAQQGDPLGPLLDAAALHLVVLRLRRQFPGHTVRAYHDDLTILGPPAGLAAALTTAAAATHEIDAVLAPAKCAAWSPTPQLAPAGLQVPWRTQGIVQFSVPLGSPAFVADHGAATAAGHDAVLAAIDALPAEELLTQLLLLRLCAGPRVNNAVRCLPPEAGATLAAHVDAASRRTFLDLLTTPVDTPATRAALTTRAAQPVADGGLGVGYCSTVVAAAQLASWCDSLHAGPTYSAALAEVATQLGAAPRRPGGADPLAPPPGPPPAPPHRPHHPRRAAATPAARPRPGVSTHLPARRRRRL